MKKFISKLKNKMKEKKGASMVEFTVSMTIFVMLFVTAYEVYMIAYKYLEISNFTNELATKIAIQGGIEPQTPSGFQDTQSKYKYYITSGDLESRIKALNEKIGNEAGAIDVVLEYYPPTGSVRRHKLSGSSSIEVPYLEPFYVEVSYDAEFEILNNFLTNSSLGRVKKKKAGVSEFLHDYEEENRTY